MVLRPERFTEQAQKVLHDSQEMVRRYRHSQWDVEHVLLALLELENGLPGDILPELGISSEAVKARLDQVLEAGPKVAFDNTQIYPTPRPLRRAVQRHLGNSLSKQILAGDFQAGDHVVVDVNDDGLILTKRTVAVQTA